MPKTVASKDMPKPVNMSVGNLQPKARKHPEILDFQEALLKDPVRRTAEAAVYTLDDGVTNANHNSISGSLRSLARKMGYKLSIIWQPDEGALYVRFDGAYVPLTDLERAERQIKRVSKQQMKLLRQKS